MPRGARDRRAAILRLASTSGLTSVEELSNTFGVTASTIRRDLSQLESAGHLARTYGGAMALDAHHETSLRQRSGQAFEAKRSIATWAADQVRTGETILLDSGTTTGALARELATRRDLTVVTTGLTVLQELAQATNVRVECLGGTLRPLSQGFVGSLTEAALERMTFDRAFLGADGVTAEHGICEADLQQTRLKELMGQRAEHTYVLVHAAKLGHHPFHAHAPFGPGWTLVTDTAADSAATAPFHARGIDVVVVDPDGRVREEPH
ncbi:DeoR family transcriptional regulator [Halopolyspora algeriensis]|uniref:DeoR family transcriptional regulator n=1 Tax=Halopolyspora algeriensis TaxID=1500506 RepID=A0A368VJY5_9ACTN|nr:DeoR/GlpR family DNA-binding transcription regulator [Halopolyspora algeriensis]RCW41072.1 DeoR family transcriptional regulator [Halopolyspora algeriensis]TQM53844.1 DeoR family transcriptional regulator [Halopolyspora algeriensis]